MYTTSIGSSADGSCKSCTSICGLGEADSVSTGPVTFAGTRLNLPECGTSLSIPEGALPKGVKEQIYLAVLREDRHRPKLRGTLEFHVLLQVTRKHYFFKVNAQS